VLQGLVGVGEQEDTKKDFSSWALFVFMAWAVPAAHLSMA
jgi:hypothetical protein